ncbi:hypothetical protein [Oryza sativa Japonica Group]|uniref:Uncharacterized protein n=1 Tax=Oryza sativa subsp. japonica TaxID=39947 RepID=Q5QM54_ORYSJ|nr:hypothetical protein [Oryza sativa Japonica Group]BAD87072.1 hypothetical protein [Oryza sativa Japonica Group]
MDWVAALDVTLLLLPASMTYTVVMDPGAIHSPKCGELKARADKLGIGSRAGSLTATVFTLSSSLPPFRR